MGVMVEGYKILHGYYDKEAAQFLILWTDMAPRRDCGGHSLKV